MCVLSALKRLAGFLFLALMVVGIKIVTHSPLLVLTAAAVGLVSGVALCLFGLITTERYRNVFDFEPAEFLGKMRNGKQAREILAVMTASGLWCTLIGVGLLLVWFVNRMSA